MLHFYFKDKLINDFFYKDVFCVPLELSSKLGLKLEINFISSDENIINPYLNNENIKIIVHKNYFYMILYFVKSLRKIKILGLFHLYSHSFLFSLVYKLINKKGKVYIKGDFNIYAINNLINLNKKYKKLLEYLLNKIDFLSFENNNLLNIFKNNIFYKNKILLIKNSLSLEKNKIQNNYKAKENIILALGRIYYEDVKRYSFLLKSLYNLGEQLKNWKIIFIGKTLGEFSGKSYDFLLENKEIIDNLITKGIKLEFLGSIYDRNLLYSYLNKAKIFSLPSISEGDPLVQYEAMYYSNIMVSTDVGTIKENYYNKGLFISEVNDLEQYEKNLLSAVVLTYEENINTIYGDIHNHCIKNYTRENNLDELIKILKGN